MIKRLFLVLFLLALLFAGIFGWKYLQGQKMAARAAMPPPPATIAATTVQTDRWQTSLTAVGSLVASQGVSVSSEIAGQVIEIDFKSGQSVTKNDLLVKLDDDVDKAELASLVAAKKLAELQFKRTSDLIKDKLVSRADFDSAKAGLDSARALVASKQASIRKKTIRAPFSGQLGIRQINLGQYLGPGTDIVTLQSLQPIYAEFSLPERYLSQLSVDQAIEIHVQAYADKKFAGHIQAISPLIESGSRSIRIRATLENPDLLLRPGMYAEVRVVLPGSRDVLTLNNGAISYNPYGDTVFVIEASDTGQVVQRKQIKTGTVRNGRIEILSGLTAGDRVVSAGHNKLRNGQAVKIDNSIELNGQASKP